MDQPEAEGIRLLSFDGGDLSAISQLIILDEVMRRIEWDRKSTTRILPCDYFHMIAGVGTGGIIALLLAILRMSIEEATEEFLNIWQLIYTDAALDPTTRSAKLEDLMKNLLKHKGIDESCKMCPSEEEENGCKTYVCVVSESNLGVCEKFRNYRSRQASLDPTIVQAIRGTCAMPNLFLPVSILSPPYRISYVTGAYNFNNPTWETIKEACDLFGRRRAVSCVLSLGCPKKTLYSVAATASGRDNVAQIIQAIQSDCELVDRDLRWRIGRSGVYHRFCVDSMVQLNSDSPKMSPGDVISHTKVYLGLGAITEGIDQCVVVAQRLGRVTLIDISGINEPLSASAHGLPLLSAFFVERPGIVRKMAESLFRIGPLSQRKMVLSGLGGIGKTQITVSFLLQFLSRFRHVLFIDGSSLQSIESGIIAKIKSLGVAYSRMTAKESLDVLANPDHEITRDWAIIYDNVDDPNVNIADYFPHCHFGTIIITTRNPNLGNLAPTAHLKLEVMSEGEAIDVLLRSALDPARMPTVTDETLARDIAKALGYLPVALVQAGYFIKLHDCMPEYLRRLIKRRPQILNRPAAAQLDKHYHGIYATLEVTWPHLSARAQGFLSILGFVNYTGFPVLLIGRAVLRGFSFEPSKFLDQPMQFQHSVDLLRNIFQPDEDWDEQDVDDLIAELEQYSLVSRMTTFMVMTLRLHPLVHSWIHDRLSQGERDAYRAATIRLLVCGTGDEDDDIFEFIYPHVTVLSGQLKDLHVNDRAGIANVFTHQGDFLTSVSLWCSICSDLLESYGPDDLRISEANLKLASVYRKSRNQRGMVWAVEIERAVAERRGRVLGPEHPMTINAIVQQAQGMAETQNSSEVPISLLRHAVSFWETRDGDNWEPILQVKGILASVLGSSPQIHRIKEAVDLHTEVLEARMERNGPDHHATLKATEALADTYDVYITKAERADESVSTSASDLWMSLVDTRTKKRGAHHPDTLAAMGNLAWSYWYEGADKMAVEHVEKVILLRREAQGLLHKDTIEATAELAGLYVRCERYEEAEARYKEVIALRKEAGDLGYWHTRNAKRSLADMYEERERFQEAEAVLLDAQDEVDADPWAHEHIVQSLKRVSSLFAGSTIPADGTN